MKNRPRIVLITLCLWAAAGVSAAQSPEYVDLHSGARTLFYGGELTIEPRAGDFLGWVVASGDLDGDGYEDIVASSIEADGTDDQRGSSGEVYVVFGGLRTEVDSLRDLSEDADVIFRGARAGDHLGWSIVCANIDGDRYADLVISAPSSDGLDSSRFESGEIYLFYGRPRREFLPTYDMRSNDPNIRIIGDDMATHIGGFEYDDTRFGRLVNFGLTAGELNGDKYTDVVFSSVDAEIVYILFGGPRAGLPAVVDAKLSTNEAHPDVILHSELDVEGFVPARELGFALECADLDGDGIDDLLASAYHGDGEDALHILAGEIYCWWGRKNWNDQYDIVLGEYDAVLQGPSGYRAGYRLSSGDLDGDGRDDLIVGGIIEAYAPTGRSNVGDYRILFGRSRTSWPRRAELVYFADVLLVGADTGDRSTGAPPFDHAFSIATGDYDGDDMDDLLITAPGADGPPWIERSGAGEAYLIRGRRRTSWEPFWDLREDPDLVIYGAEGSTPSPPPPSPWAPQDHMAWSGCLADFDGNGRKDIVLSSLFADGPNNFRPECGEVYVVYDTDTTSAPTASRPLRVPSARLLPGYPNPFHSQTTIRFVAPRGSRASVTVYDALGRRVASPLSGEIVTTEERQLTWMGKDQAGASLPSGVYFVRLVVDGRSYSQKITLLR